MLRVLGKGVQILPRAQALVTLFEGFAGAKAKTLAASEHRKTSRKTRNRQRQGVSRLLLLERMR